MILAVLLPRFELVIAAGGRERLAAGGPAALAPEPGREQMVGEVSPAAEAFGIHPGMRLGEALGRCPQLGLIPPDPMGVADAWEKLIRRLETIGAAVETPVAGLAFFDARSLARLHGGHGTGDPAAALRARMAGKSGPTSWLEGVVDAARGALRVPVRMGAGPSRFCALAGAARARSRKLEIVDGAGALAAEPVALLRRRPEVQQLVEPLERLGLMTLGALAALPRTQISDRFGRAGEQAHDLALGCDAPLRPREPGEVLEESLELPESASGPQLERALELLIDRLVARRERRGRTLRSVVIGARLVEGGTWRERVVFREALADPARMRLVLVQRLSVLPAPAETLRLAVERFGPSYVGARALFDDAATQRGARLREAIRQARAAAGPEAALRVLAIDPDSRIPERRTALAPYEQ
jgi:protein ImuB